MKWFFAAAAAVCLFACGGPQASEDGLSKGAERSGDFSSAEFIADPDHPLSKLDGSKWCDLQGHTFTFLGTSSKVTGLPASCDSGNRSPSNECACERNGDVIATASSGPVAGFIAGDFDYPGQVANIPNTNIACYAAGWTITYRDQSRTVSYRPKTGQLTIGSYSQLNPC